MIVFQLSELAGVEKPRLDDSFSKHCNVLYWQVSVKC